MRIGHIDAFYYWDHDRLELSYRYPHGEVFVYKTDDVLVFLNDHISQEYWDWAPDL